MKMSPRIYSLKKDLNYLKNHNASTTILSIAVMKVAQHYRTQGKFYLCLVNGFMMRSLFMNPNRLPN